MHKRRNEASTRAGSRGVEEPSVYLPLRYYGQPRVHQPVIACDDSVRYVGSRNEGADIVRYAIRGLQSDGHACQAAEEQFMV